MAARPFAVAAITVTALIFPHSAAQCATTARMVANYEACVDREISAIVADALASTWPDKRANMYRSIHETLASKCRAAIVSSLPETESRQIVRYQTGSVDAELKRQLESSRAKNREIEAMNAAARPQASKIQSCEDSELNCRIRGRIAKGTSFPEYPDPTPSCRSTLKNEILFNNCIKDAQRGYDSANSLWPNMSNDTKARCLLTADNAPDWAKYTVLGDCAVKLYYGVDVPRQPAEPFRR